MTSFLHSGAGFIVKDGKFLVGSTSDSCCCGECCWRRTLVPEGCPDFEPPFDPCFEVDLRPEDWDLTPFLDAFPTLAGSPDTATKNLYNTALDVGSEGFPPSPGWAARVNPIWWKAWLCPHEEVVIGGVKVLNIDLIPNDQNADGCEVWILRIIFGFLGTHLFSLYFIPDAAASPPTAPSPLISPFIGFVDNATSSRDPSGRYYYAGMTTPFNGDVPSGLVIPAYLDVSISEDEECDCADAVDPDPPVETASWFHHVFEFNCETGEWELAPSSFCQCQTWEDIEAGGPYGGFVQVDDYTYYIDNHDIEPCTPPTDCEFDPDFTQELIWLLEDFAGTPECDECGDVECHPLIRLVFDDHDGNSTGLNGNYDFELQTVDGECVYVCIDHPVFITCAGTPMGVPDIRIEGSDGAFDRFILNVICPDWATSGEPGTDPAGAAFELTATGDPGCPEEGEHPFQGGGFVNSVPPPYSGVTVTVIYL